MHVKAIDHLVLNVADVERALEFYTGPLGLRAERVDEWRAGKVGFPTVRINESTIIDLLDAPRDGLNVHHFCLAIEPLDWQELIESGEFTVIKGPVDRFGARGMARSVYVEDPDGNVIELRWYPEDADR
ncbi:VOC family protein [Actinomadura sp. NAK00032]|uniref:VOC family protein n=1 Tax=Actinomadura sp. NAK00032 TaxID=2742128 RepID=UPI001592900D|nr:VOC family protein [Actinomadura sp. NAK00032]QKW39826.1 VOC family protein [Actinomadura sp. NAK00032]